MDVDPNYDPSDFLKLPNIKQERLDPEPELQSMQTYEQEMYQQFQPMVQQQIIKQQTDDIHLEQQQHQQQHQQQQQDFMQMPDNLMMFQNNDNMHEVCFVIFLYETLSYSVWLLICRTSVSTMI